MSVGQLSTASKMLPALVMPLYDPEGLVLPRLEAVTPALKELFAQVFLGVDPVTCRAQGQRIAALEQDPFFEVVDTISGVGHQFFTVYRAAAVSCRPERVLHLCSVDRVVFALSTEHRQPFIDDVRRASSNGHSPLIFQRSPAAWASHPDNYWRLEHMVTEAGEMLFGRSLDFAWCHLVVRAGVLASILPRLQARDLSLVAELVLLLLDVVETEEVDWLAWEDPFILGRDPQLLRKEREESVVEVRKRLGYVVPMLRLLEEAAGAQ